MLVGSCTSFYGLHPDATSASTATGSGGAPPVDRGLLPKLDAAHLCALVSSCPDLGASIVASTGLPIVEIASGTITVNFSACVDWLTLPLAPSDGSSPGARLGFDVVRGMIVCMAASSACDDAQRCAFEEALSPGDPRCSPPLASCDAKGDFVDCSNGRVDRCRSDLLAPDSTCTTAATVTACASGLCTEAEKKCDKGYLFECSANEPKRSLNCAAFGLACDDSAVVAAQRGCAGQSGVTTCALSAMGQQSCIGNRVQTCSGVVNAEVDCSVIGETCSAELGAQGPARCKRADATCSPYDATTNVCSGNTISTCLDGIKDAIDCSIIGSSCLPAASGVSAHCG